MEQNRKQLHECQNLAPWCEPGKTVHYGGRIATVTEAHEYLTEEYEWDEESKVDFYLLFLDPPEIITDAWESRRNEMTEDFDDALFDVGYSDNVMSEYPLIKGVETNLIQQYHELSRLACPESTLSHPTNFTFHNHRKESH